MVEKRNIAGEIRKGGVQHFKRITTADEYVNIGT